MVDGTLWTRAAAALVAILVSAAPAAAKQVVFGGIFLVTGAAQSCSYYVGSNRNMFFSTIVYGADAEALLISDFYQTLTISPKGRNKFGRAGTYIVQQIDRWNGLSTWNSSYSNFVFSPRNYNSGTRSLVITGRIEKYGNLPDCWVDFRAVGTPTG